MRLIEPLYPPLSRVARFSLGKYGRLKKDGNFHAKCHRISLKKPCRNTEDLVKYGRSGNPIQLIDKSVAVEFH